MGAACVRKWTDALKEDRAPRQPLLARTLISLRPSDPTRDEATTPVRQSPARVELNSICSDPALTLDRHAVSSPFGAHLSSQCQPHAPMGRIYDFITGKGAYTLHLKQATAQLHVAHTARAHAPCLHTALARARHVPALSQHAL